MDAADEDSTTTISNRKKVDHRYVPWDILVRGRNTGASKLLDWLVSSIAEFCSLC
jgi:hypothetical protein